MIANCRAADTNAAPQTDSEIDLGAAADFLEALGAKYPTFQTFGEGEAKGDKKLARIMDGTLKSTVKSFATSIYVARACSLASTKLMVAVGRERTLNACGQSYLIWTERHSIR
jgi:hypothetical protein